LKGSSRETPVWRIVLGTELLGLVRDRRALFTALVLPALLYPLLFLGQGWLHDIGEESLDAKEVRIAYDLSSAPAEESARLIELLGQEVPIELESLPPASFTAIEEAVHEGSPESWARERDLVVERIGPEGNLLLYAVPDPDAPRGTLYRIFFDGADETSREARERTRSALATLREEVEGRRYDELFGGDPGAALATESRDLASQEDLGGALIGRLLPMIAVLVLLSGGSYAALAAFAGEREAGTLETLLVQPVPTASLVWGKFLAVLITGLLTLFLNTSSLFVTAAMGLGNLPGAEGGLGDGPGALRMLIACAQLLPVCLLLSSALCLVCGKARSFREGQHYVLPLSLIALLPTALALQPEVELDALLACIPLAGPALAFREALVGQLGLVNGALAMGSTLVYSVLLLRQLGGLLDGEKVLTGRATAEELSLRHVSSRQALSWGWAGVLAVYIFGGLAQSASPIWGLVATLWVLLLPLAYFAVRATAQRAGESIPRALGLRMPAAYHAAGALLCAPALAALARMWIEWQERVLPMPSSMTESSDLFAGFDALSPPVLFFLFAISPGICEELFFRGAVLSGLRREMPAWKSILWQALLFGAVHASIYRFAPTAALGALLAALTLRSRSIFPAMILHIAYNGSLVNGDALPWLQASWIPWLLAPGLLLFALPPRRRG